MYSLTHRDAHQGASLAQAIGTLHTDPTVPRLSRARRQEIVVQADVQQLLQEKQAQGRNVLGDVGRTLDAAYDQAPFLEFLEANPNIPKDVRDRAAAYRPQLGSYIDSLENVQAAVSTWTSKVDAALVDAQHEGEHHLLDASADWWSMLGTDHATQIQSAYQQVVAQGLPGVDFAARLEHFLAGQRTYQGATADIGKCFTPTDKGFGSVTAPKNIQALNYESAYYASWEVQASLFRHGTPMAHNLNLRRRVFSDKSYVDIQAHQPALTYTGFYSDVNVGAVAVGAGFLVSAGGIPAGLPGMVAGWVIGATLGASLMAGFREKGAVWQGYTACYYSPSNPHQPWGVRHFYGWKKLPLPSSDAPTKDAPDPATLCNFADDPVGCTWWKWRSGHADAREPVFDGSGQKENLGATPARLQSSVQQLVQSLARFAPSSAAPFTVTADQVDGGGLLTTPPHPQLT